MTAEERFINKIETYVTIGLSEIEAAEKRGRLSDEDLKYINDIEWSKLPIALKCYEIARRDKGKFVRNRDWLIPNVLEKKGLYVSNKGGRPEIYLYGPIGESHGGVSADEFRSQLAKLAAGEPIDLHIHSPGGSFTEAVAIHSLIRNRRSNVYGFVDGNAASAGSLILMPCISVTMAPASQMMIHFASVQSEGSWSEQDLAQALKHIQDTNDKLVDLYAPRWRGSKSALRDALAKETYFTPAEAVERGLADYVSERVKVAAYEVVTGSCKTPGFEIAASEDPHKRFYMRGVKLKLWQLEVDEMRRELELT